MKTLLMAEMDNSEELMQSCQAVVEYPQKLGDPLEPDWVYTPKIPRHSYFEDFERNMPQLKSAFPAIYIFASGGVSLIWSFGFSPVYKSCSEGTLIHMQVCWFVGVILGACIGTILSGKISKLHCNLLGSILVIVNGILFFLTPESVTNAIIARYCDGIAFGLTVITTIVVDSQQSVKRFRGHILTLEQYGLVFGIFFYMLPWRSEGESINGFLAIIFGVSGLIVALIWRTESPLCYLRKGDKAKAIFALSQLQTPSLVTPETYALLNENKDLLDEDIARGRSVNISIGVIPMVKLCLFRALVSMSLTVTFAWGFRLASALTSPDVDHWMLNSFAAMRLIGLLFAMNSIDILGRKAVSVTGLLVGGVLLFGVGAIFSTYSEPTDSVTINTAKGLLMAYQVFAGMAAPASTCYLGEAFSISVKPYFILVVIAFENIIQIIVCCAFNGTLVAWSDYEYYLGGFQIAFGILFIFGFPETKQTTLREALFKFTKVESAKVFFLRIVKTNQNS